jgi:SagB-type dehydrogenase family enzyme
LAALLYFGAAVTRETVDEFRIKWGFRCAPSGGALYPIDTYCFVFKVVSLEPGLYACDCKAHELQLLKRCDFEHSLSEATYAAESLQTASFCILMVANFSRSKFKYDERAYRFVLLEAGHIVQNMLLSVACSGHNAFPIGGYLDDALNGLVGVDGCDQAVVYGLIAGCRARLRADATRF